MKKYGYAVSCLMGLIFTLYACCRETEPELPPETQWIPVLPDTPYDYLNIHLPPDFSLPPLGFTPPYPADNPTTNAGATLGRVLFYDRQLSLNNSISCGSCHLQSRGFADPMSKSTGFNGALTDRNSMSTVNLRFSNRFFWDLRTNTLEEQVLQPIQHPIEMGMDLPFLVERLSAISYYPPLFQEAFGSTEITHEKIAFALAQFVRSIYSYQSKYDLGSQTGFANFSELEKQGKDLYLNGSITCNFCHTGANFSGNQALNNGLDSVYADAGRAGITQNPEDIGKFKVPTLRNIALTGPYMHDGRFASLAEVIEFYNQGIQPHPNLDDRLTEEGIIGGTPRKLNMSSQEKAALLAFLQTLTDEVLINDPKFSDPFVEQ